MSKIIGHIELVHYFFPKKRSLAKVFQLFFSDFESQPSDRLSGFSGDKPEHLGRYHQKIIYSLTRKLNKYGYHFL